MSKTKSVQEIQEAYDAGQRHFGENYIQEIISKAPELPSDIKWHFIGHIQSNKAKLLLKSVPNLFLVETVDSIKLANLLNKETRETKLNVMIQVNTSGEAEKSGVSPSECLPLVQHVLESCSQLEFCGLMTIGRYGETTPVCFESLVACREKVASAIGKSPNDIELSMGMSGDFETAIKLGSTSVRVGSLIFGNR